MKGPGQRIDLDVRRIWKCPQCGKTRKLGGEITSVRCNCRREDVWMQLVEVEEDSATSPEPVDESPAPQTPAPAEQPPTPEEKSAAVGNAIDPVEDPVIDSEETRREETQRDLPTPPPDEQL